MNPDPDPNRSARDNMLAVALVMLGGGMMLFFLYLISFGIVGNVLAGAGLIALVASLHYLVWGKSFSDQVAAEREALRRQDEAEEKRKAQAMGEAIQDLSRVQGIQKK
jgi:hypothetical protein